MKIDGSCHCKQITYTAEIDPSSVTICHCADCQTQSGTAFRTLVPAKKADFHVKGEPKIYVKKTADSGNLRALAFCPECGTSLYSTTVTDPQLYNIRLGTARQRTELPPKSQQWMRSACSWLASIPTLASTEKQR